MQRPPRRLSWARLALRGLARIQRRHRRWRMLRSQSLGRPQHQRPPPRRAWSVRAAAAGMQTRHPASTARPPSAAQAAVAAASSLQTSACAAGATARTRRTVEQGHLACTRRPRAPPCLETRRRTQKECSRAAAALAHAPGLLHPSARARAGEQPHHSHSRTRACEAGGASCGRLTMLRAQTRSVQAPPRAVPQLGQAAHRPRTGVQHPPARSLPLRPPSSWGGYGRWQAAGWWQPAQVVGAWMNLIMCANSRWVGLPAVRGARAGG